MQNETARNNSWPNYGYLLIWSPIILGIVLPFLIVSMYEPSFINYFIDDAEEFVSMLIGFSYCSIPFAIVSYLTMRDKRVSVAFRIAVQNWLRRFIPPLVFYLIFLISIIMAAVRKQPGASTAPIALIFSPFLGSLLVCLGNSFVQRRK